MSIKTSRVITGELPLKKKKSVITSTTTVEDIFNHSTGDDKSLPPPGISIVLALELGAVCSIFKTLTHVRYCTQPVMLSTVLMLRVLAK